MDSAKTDLIDDVEPLPIEPMVPMPIMEAPPPYAPVDQQQPLQDNRPIQGLPRPAAAPSSGLYSGAGVRDPSAGGPIPTMGGQTPADVNSYPATCGQYPATTAYYPAAGTQNQAVGGQYPPAVIGQYPAGNGVPLTANQYPGYAWPQQPAPAVNNTTTIITQQPTVVMAPHVPDHTTYAVLVTFFCCLPFGIVAWIKACSCRSALAVGDYVTASRYSEEARNWARWGLIVGVCLGVGSFVLGGILRAVAAANQ